MRETLLSTGRALLLLAFCLTAMTGLFARPGDAAETGLVCWDEGNACIVFEEGQPHAYHGKWEITN